MNFSILSYYKNIILDYDGTISRIPVDWKKVRSEFLSFAHNKFNYRFDDSLRLDEMEHILLSKKSLNPKTIFQIRKDAENMHIGKHINNEILIEYIQKNDNYFFIVSNNLHDTILRNINELGILHKFKKIIGCDTYYSSKPSILSWHKLANEFNLQTSNTLVVGDSPQTDGLYAKKIGLPYFQIPSFT
jgi:HAD superfamily hydrolase (TIGR01549 family)